MENIYIIKIMGWEKVLCKNDEELSLFLTHIDKERFTIEHIDTINNVGNFKEYCKKDKDLETGKK